MCVLCVITMILLSSSVPSSSSSVCLGHDLRMTAVASALCAKRSLVPLARVGVGGPRGPHGDRGDGAAGGGCVH